MTSPQTLSARDRTRTYDSSSSTGSPERRTQDDIDNDIDNDFFQHSTNDSSTSIVEPEKIGDEEIREFEAMTVSRTAYLPPELLFAIFGRLASPHDLQACVLVCKSWARCAVELLWIRPYITKFGSLESLARTLQMERPSFPYASLIKRLNLTTLLDSLNDGTILPLATCNKLERLTLTNCSMITDTSITPILKNNPRLLALDLSGLSDLTDLSIQAIAKHCRKIQGLNLTSCRKITDASIIAVAGSCSHLKRLKLNDCDQITNEGIMSFTKYCPNLLELDLHKVSKITNQAVLDIFWRLTHLRELRLAHCDLLTDHAFTSIPQRPYESLRILDLTNCDKLTDDSVEHIVNICPRLRNLVLAKCRLITDRAVMAITKLTKNLHYLHLGHCTQLTDSAITALIRSCNRIRYIDLACCQRLTDRSVTQLATLPKLRRIGLVKCSNITDRSLMALVHSNRTQPCALERVHLSYCTNLTVDGIHELVNSCTKLTHLSLTGVVCFLRKDLTRFCRAPPPEFNEHQRMVFCVFSGPGVTKLRNHLNQLAATNGSTAPDQAYYDDREDQENILVEDEDDDDDDDEIHDE